MDIELNFRGTFPCAVDQKRRLTVPSRFAKALTPRAKRTFVAVHGPERCLVLYPLDYWTTFQKNLQRARISDAETRKGVRRLLASAEDVPMDNQNRISLTPALLEYGRIRSDALLVGANERLELWSPEQWDDFMKDSPSIETAYVKIEDIIDKTNSEILEEREALSGSDEHSTES